MVTVPDLNLDILLGERMSQGMSIQDMAACFKKLAVAIQGNLCETVGFDITPSVMKMGSFTVVYLRAIGKGTKQGQTYEALGFTRKSKKDKDNPALAETIAKGRAMKALEMKIRGYSINKKYMG